MTTDTHVMLSCTMTVNGERVTSRQLVPVAAWEDEAIREHITRGLQLAVADRVVEHLAPEVVVSRG